MNKLSSLLIVLFLGFAIPSFAISQPIAVDSRIKTLVYSENEVFRVVIHYGWQTVIEFAENEEVQTISVGNNYAWQITPLDRRLFIKPLEENIFTNMTVITNMRTYQFEIQSKSFSYARDDELALVIRFFYPDSEDDKILPEVEERVATEQIPIEKPFNYNYTMSGPNAVSLLEIFDDGIGTFFKFDGGSSKAMPRFQVKDGEKLMELTPRYRGVYVYVNKVAKEFLVSDKNKTLHVFNEDYDGAVK